VEAPPVAEQQLLGLELGQQPGADEQAGQLVGLLRQRRGAGQVGQAAREALLLQQAALADQRQELLDRGRRRHGCPLLQPRPTGEALVVNMAAPAPATIRARGQRRPAATSLD
jgi:hypothetical protein